MPEFEPVLTFKSRIVYMKDVASGTPLGYSAAFYTRRPSRIATVPVGYADGLSHALSNRGYAIVRGQARPHRRQHQHGSFPPRCYRRPGHNIGDEVMSAGADRPLLHYRASKLPNCSIPYPMKSSARSANACHASMWIRSLSFSLGARLPPGEKLGKDLAVDGHSQRGVHAEFLQARDLLVRGDSARRGDGQLGDGAQTAEPFDVRSLQSSFPIDVSAKKPRTVWFELGQRFRGGERQRLLPTMNGHVAADESTAIRIFSRGTAAASSRRNS